MIDWSGEAVARPKGLALAVAEPGDAAPELVRPAGGWSREGLGDWLFDHARAGSDLLIGLDLSPGLPFADAGAYLPGWPDSPADAKALWRLVDERSADSAHLGVGALLADPQVARHFRHRAVTGDRFPVGRGRLRVCEERQRAMGLSPSSCFNLVGAAQVGKSSLTGMRVLNRLDGTMPVWPFDPVPASGPLIVEIYTSIAARAAGLRPGRSKLRSWEALDSALTHPAIASDPTGGTGPIDDHASDAILTAAWLRRAATDALLWRPTGLRTVATTEGWTFGVR